MMVNGAKGNKARRAAHTQSGAGMRRQYNAARRWQRAGCGTAAPGAGVGGRRANQRVRAGSGRRGSARQTAYAALRQRCAATQYGAGVRQRGTAARGARRKAVWCARR